MEKTGKNFRKRNAILACLRQSKAHPSAEAVFDAVRKECPDVSLASVYRNLTLFKEQGLIVSLGTVDGTERFDGRVDPHVHFACNRCGCVMDVPELDIPEEIAGETAGRLSCRVDAAQVLLTGLCNTCLNADPVG